MTSKAITDYRHWCRENGVSLGDHRFIYADSAERIRGLTNFKVIECANVREGQRVLDSVLKPTKYKQEF